MVVFCQLARLKGLFMIIMIIIILSHYYYYYYYFRVDHSEIAALHTISREEAIFLASQWRECLSVRHTALAGRECHPRRLNHTPRAAAAVRAPAPPPGQTAAARDSPHHPARSPPVSLAAASPAGQSWPSTATCQAETAHGT